MKARHLCATLVVALASLTAANGSDSPAGNLPSHIVAVRGDDAWSGRLRALQFLPTLGTLDAPTPQDLWEAASALDERPPIERQLWTFHRDDTGSRTPVGLHWLNLSPTQQAQLDGDDKLGAMRIDYLRGLRMPERDGSGFRSRKSILGAMLGAHVKLLGPPGFVLDASHTSFRQNHAQRPWMAYIGANDGMLHGFDALTGIERFAIMPDAALPTAARNASPAQPVPRPLCARPFAADALIGMQWHSILSCANGTMGSGLFLVDVTNPESATPPPMLAYDANDDAAVGQVEGPIPIVSLANGGRGNPRWFAISGNGTGRADVGNRLLLLALDQPRTSPWQSNTAHAITVPSGADRRGGLGAPAVALGPQGTATLAYAPDTRGQIWRFDLRDAPPWPNALGTNHAQRRTPFFKAKSRTGGTQRIVSPILLAATAGGQMLVFVAVDEASSNTTLYGVADTGARGLSRDNLAGLSVTDDGDGSIIRLEGSTIANGWRIDLPMGQLPDELTTAGTNSLLLTTRDADRRQHAYLLDAHTGLPTNKAHRTGHVLIGTPIITTQTAAPAPTPSGSVTQATHTGLWQLAGERIRQLESRIYTRQLGRLSWREMTEEGAR
ncbi:MULTISPECIES: pilus assembly protein [Ralstonia]|uniref:pilus assembly protein n=1 Tax=Ralstonia TaxID=48736 RepID=UPI00038698DB|nr:MULTISPECIES: PilC/PilY family type IV pilus protein [Ralstonia]EPX97360.1 hypothetical protein C404_14235 [Ralstonia sp. AU12-08]MBY4703412.1 pilus assembly protein PilY [Ralstonia insidiosa]